MVKMFMRDLKKMSALECPLWGGFVIKDSLGIRPGQIFCPSQRGIRFREVPMYYTSVFQETHQDHQSVTLRYVETKILKLK